MDNRTDYIILDNAICLYTQRARRDLIIFEKKGGGGEDHLKNKEQIQGDMNQV